jgi:hypothetical protein
MHEVRVAGWSLVWSVASSLVGSPAASLGKCRAWRLMWLVERVCGRKVCGDISYEGVTCL